MWFKRRERQPADQDDAQASEQDEAVDGLVEEVEEAQRAPSPLRMLRRGVLDRWYHLAAPPEVSAFAEPEELETVRRGKLASLVILGVLTSAWLCLPLQLALPGVSMRVLAVLSGGGIAVLLNRRGHLYAAGLVLVAAVEVAVLSVMGLPLVGAASTVVISAYALLVIPEVLAAALLPPVGVFAVALLHSTFIVVDVYGRTGQVGAGSEFTSVVAPMVLLQGSIALITWLWLSGTVTALRHAERAGDIVDLEQREVRLRFQLEDGTISLLEAHNQVLAGAHVVEVWGLEHPALQRIGESFNAVARRVRDLQQEEQTLRTFAAQAHALTTRLNATSLGEPIAWPEEDETPLGAVLSALRRHFEVPRAEAPQAAPTPEVGTQLLLPGAELLPEVAREPSAEALAASRQQTELLADALAVPTWRSAAPTDETAAEPETVPTEEPVAAASALPTEEATDDADDEMFAWPSDEMVARIAEGTEPWPPALPLSEAHADAADAPSQAWDPWAAATPATHDEAEAAPAAASLPEGAPEPQPMLAASPDAVDGEAAPAAEVDATVAKVVEGETEVAAEPVEAAVESQAAATAEAQAVAEVVEGAAAQPTPAAPLKAKSKVKRPRRKTRTYPTKAAQVAAPEAPAAAVAEVAEVAEAPAPPPVEHVAEAVLTVDEAPPMPEAATVAADAPEAAEPVDGAWLEAQWPAMPWPEVIEPSPARFLEVYLEEYQAPQPDAFATAPWPETALPSWPESAAAAWPEIVPEPQAEAPAASMWPDPVPAADPWPTPQAEAFSEDPWQPQAEPQVDYSVFPWVEDPEDPTAWQPVAAAQWTEAAPPSDGAWQFPPRPREPWDLPQVAAETWDDPEVRVPAPREPSTEPTMLLDAPPHQPEPAMADAAAEPRAEPAAEPEMATTLLTWQPGPPPAPLSDPDPFHREWDVGWLLRPAAPEPPRYPRQHRLRTEHSVTGELSAEEGGLDTTAVGQAGETSR